jgi:hypothetical protein
MTNPNDTTAAIVKSIFAFNLVSLEKKIRSKAGRAVAHALSCFATPACPFATLWTGTVLPNVEAAACDSLVHVLRVSSGDYQTAY